MAEFRILTVCTGNVCRSPLGQLLLAEGLQDLPVQVSSAGVGALVDHGMPDPALAIARGLGLTTAEAHRARQITADMLREADLVLPMAREHRRAIVELVPRASRNTFTLREFARIAAALPDDAIDDAVRSGTSPEERMRLAVEEVGFSRGTVPPPASPDDDNVIDPYRRSDAVYAESTAQLTPAVAQVVALLRRAAGAAA
jgi:protein-tyrosine phosphatase